MRFADGTSRQSARPWLVLLVWIVCVFCVAQGVAAQDPQPQPQPQPSGTQPQPSGTQSNVPQPSTSATPTPQPLPPCGLRPGTTLPVSPLSTTLGVVAQPLRLAWSFNDLVSPRFPATSVSLYFTPTSAVPAAWRLIAVLPPSARNYTWTVPNLSDGEYRVRYVFDDIDPERGNGTCIPDGFPRPGVSQGFKIMNSLPLRDYPDTFGPNESAGVKTGSNGMTVTGVVGWVLGLVGVFSL